jgi:hypothetical protein
MAFLAAELENLGGASSSPCEKPRLLLAISQLKGCNPIWFCTVQIRKAPIKKRSFTQINGMINISFGNSRYF